MQKTEAKTRIDAGIAILVRAGGLCAALVLPALIAFTGFIIPFTDPMTLTKLLKIVAMTWGRVLLFFVMVLPIWYGLHSILQLFENRSVPMRKGPLLFYGLAFAWSAHIGYVLFILERGA